MRRMHADIIVSRTGTRKGTASTCLMDPDSFFRCFLSFLLFLFMNFMLQSPKIYLYKFMSKIS